MGVREVVDRAGLRGRARGRARAAAGALRRADEAAEEADRVGEAQDQVEEAVSAAVEAGLPADALLLDEQERRVAAGASDDQPFGSRGPAARGGLLRSGFAVTAGGLLAVGLAAALLAVEHQLLLVLVALFVAVGLDPAVAFLVRRGLSRGWAVAVVSLTALALLVGFLAAIAAPLSREVTALVDAAPGYLGQLRTAAAPSAGSTRSST